MYRPCRKPKNKKIYLAKSLFEIQLDLAVMHTIAGCGLIPKGLECARRLFSRLFPKALLDLPPKY